MVEKIHLSAAVHPRCCSENGQHISQLTFAASVLLRNHSLRRWTVLPVVVGVVAVIVLAW